jgi:uncharacterized protein (DUF2147 family)
VSALAGLGDDSRYLQISAPVQPGNSGGPLLDASGHLVGIVTAKLNAVRIAKFTGDIPQNVNFAVKAEVAKTFLDSKGIAYRKGASDPQLSPADVGDIGRQFTVYVRCKQDIPRSAPASATISKPPPPNRINPTSPDTGAPSIVPARVELTAAGLWEQVDDKSGKAESWFRITERNGVYEGTIVKIFPNPGQDQNPICYRCEGADRGKPFVGLTLIKSMHRHYNNYEDGTITDPLDGSVYRALMRVSPDGQKLEVRGYIGTPLLGRSQIWYRLPDDVLQQTLPARTGANAQPTRR